MNKKKILSNLMVACVATMMIVAMYPSFMLAQNPPGHHLLKKIVIGGEGSWDYLTLDVQTRLLYIAHSTVVEILNVDTGVKGEPILNLKGVHGVALAPDLGRGFISNGRSATVSIFDLKTGKISGEVPTGKNPDAITYDGPTHRVFAFNAGSDSATVIDASSGKVVGTVDLGGGPEFSVPDGKGMIYVNLEDKSEIVGFEARTLEIKHRWPLAPGEGPSGLAIDLKNRRLFSVCGNKELVVMDADSGKVVASLPIGGGVDAVRFDPSTGLIFSSNGEGTLTVIHQDSPDRYEVEETVVTARGARTLELDPKTHRVFLATAEFGPAPAATKEKPRPRPTIMPGTFMILEFGK